MTVSSGGFDHGSGSTVRTPSPGLNHPGVVSTRATAGPDGKAAEAGGSAGFVSRFLAMAIDLAVISVMALAAGGAAQLVQLLLPKWIWLTTAIPAVVTVVIAVLPLAYFSTTGTVAGQTVGKGLMGLHVVRMDGRRLGFARTLLRTIAYLVSLVPLFAGFLWILVDRDRRGWHDHIAGSRVVFDHRPGVGR
jgi:uncharacterized RDD family membrane protein YckC